MRNNIRGQSLVEYALILALVSIIVILALSQLGINLNKTSHTINNAMVNPVSNNNVGSNVQLPTPIATSTR